MNKCVFVDSRNFINRHRGPGTFEIGTKSSYLFICVFGKGGWLAKHGEINFCESTVERRELGNGWNCDRVYRDME